MKIIIIATYALPTYVHHVNPSQDKAVNWVELLDSWTMDNKRSRCVRPIPIIPYCIC